MKPEDIPYVTKGEALLDELWDNLTGRKGFHMDDVDEDVIEEWREEWLEIINRHF